MFLDDFKPVSKQQVNHLIHQGSLQEWYIFMRDVAPFVIWYLEASEQYVSADRHPRDCSGGVKPYSIYPANALRSEVDLHSDKCVPSVIRGGPQAAHWKVWVCEHEVYRAGLVERFGGDKDGRLVGLAFSPIPNAMPHDYYLVMRGKPLVMPTLALPMNKQEFTTYVEKVNALKFPGTDIPVIQYFISFLHWTRFDGDSLSLVNLLAMFVCVTHPEGFPPQAIFLLTGPQGSGKSDLLKLLQQLVSAYDLFATSADNVFKPRFTGGLEHAYYLLHEASVDFAINLAASDRIRTMVTEPGPHQFEHKGKPVTHTSGLLGVIAAGDRRCKLPRNGISERRLIEIVVPGLDMSPERYEEMSICIQNYMKWFSDENPDLVQFRSDFRQSFVNMLGLFYPAYQPDGILVPNIFRLKSYFAEAESLEQHASTSEPPAKRRRKTVGEEGVPEIWRSAVKAMLHHLALVGHPFPLESIDCFESLFSVHNTQIFTDADGQTDKGISDRGTILTELINASWEKEEIDGKTLKQICEEHREDLKKAVIERRHVGDTSRIWFRKAMIHFRKLTMIQALFNPCESLGEFYPRRWYPSAIIWLTGLWLNFLSHSKGFITPRENNYTEYGNICSTSQISHFPNWVYIVLFLKKNRGGGSTVIVSRVGLVLGVRCGSLDGSVTIRSHNVDVGPFAQLSILRDIDYGTYNPRESQIEAISQRCTKLSRVESDFKDRLSNGSKDMSARKLAEFIRTPGWQSQVAPRSMIYFQIYQALYGTSGLGIVAHEKYMDWTRQLETAMKQGFLPKDNQMTGIGDLFGCELMNPSDLRHPTIRPSSIMVAVGDGEMGKAAKSYERAVFKATTGDFYSSPSSSQSTDSDVEEYEEESQLPESPPMGKSIELSQSSCVSGILSPSDDPVQTQEWGSGLEEL